MSDFTATGSIEYDSDIDKGVKKDERAMRRFSKTTKRSMKLAKRSINSVKKDLKDLGKAGGAAAAKMGKLAGATAAAGVAVGTKRLVDADERFERLGIQARKSAEYMQELKKEIFDIASQENIRIDSNELLGSVVQLVEKSGDLAFAQENLESMALAIQASGASGQDIGALTAEFNKLGITTKAEVIEALDLLIQQGKEGAFTLENLATESERVTSAYGVMGRTGLPAIREMGAALQIIRQGTGSSEQAATVFEALLRTFGDADKIKKIKDLYGVEVFDAQGLKEGKEILRPINELITDILKATGGKKTLLSRVFDSEAAKAFGSSTIELLKDGQLTSLQRFMSIQASGSELMNDSARAAQFLTSKVDGLTVAYDRFFNTIDKNFIDKDTTQEIGFTQSVVNASKRFETESERTGGSFVRSGPYGVPDFFNFAKVLFGGDEKPEIVVKVETQAGTTATVKSSKGLKTSQLEVGN